eukprot:06707.XXX_22124_22231_1 [CDS] Oithona nana genome sequencing.
MSNKAELQEVRVLLHNSSTLDSGQLFLPFFLFIGH